MGIVPEKPWFRPGLASEFIAHLPTLAKQDRKWPLKVWAYVRKSNYPAGGNVREQKAGVLDDCIAAGVLIAGVTVCVESSSIHARRDGLMAALEAARKAGAVLVAATRCRFIRRSSFDGTHETEPPSLGDLRLLHKLADGVTLATLADPDASPAENRSEHTRRGKAAKGNPGGRPVEGRRSFRSKWQPVALELHKRGWSLRPIAQEISRRAGRSVSHTTVAKWLRVNFRLDECKHAPQGD